MITSDQLTDLCSDGKRPSAEDVAAHFADTIFWNWASTIDAGLDDQSRIDCEYPLKASEPLADLEDYGVATQSLYFESGECCIRVAEMYYSRSDETATETDAHFIANLPVYIPALLRRLRETQQEAASLRGEVATANLELLKTKEENRSLRVACITGDNGPIRHLLD